jgi:hypothetical protein
MVYDGRVRSPSTAFSNDRARSLLKQKPVKNEKHLDFIRSLPCLISLNPIETPHISVMATRATRSRRRASHSAPQICGPSP